MIYVALLRGINVGGNAKVAMSELKQTFERVGCKDVVTYINSGNVIFRDKRSSDILPRLLEAAIKEDFKLPIRVLVRTYAQIQKICETIPATYTNDSTQKTDVMFLWGEVDDSKIMQKIIIDPKLERVQYIDGCLVWNIDRKNATKGNGIKLIKTELYKHMTVRNINTVRKLQALMALLTV